VVSLGGKKMKKYVRSRKNGGEGGDLLKLRLGSSVGGSPEFLVGGEWRKGKKGGLDG